MRKIINSLAGKIFSGYITIAIVAIISFTFCISTLDNNDKIDKRIAQVGLPSILLYKDINMKASETGNLSRSWIFNPSSKDKDLLTKNLEEHWPQLFKRINAIDEYVENQGHRDTMALVEKNIHKMLLLSKKITKALPYDYSYSSDVSVDLAIELFDKLSPIEAQTIRILNNAIHTHSKNLERMKIEKAKAGSSLSLTLFIMMIVVIITGITSLISAKRKIINPINELKRVITVVSTGEMIELEQLPSSDEISEMRESIRGMIDGLKKSAGFAVEIGKGNYGVEYDALGKNDEMGNALIEMRLNLVNIAGEDEKRAWSTAGMAKFGDILRNTNDGVEELTNNIISNLVSYLGANQGGLFVINDSKPKDKFLELKACYAWDKKKFINMRINEGEGLVGQAWQENDMLYITDVPDDFIKITSGLGDANPTCFLIVPLTVNDEIFGVIEIASFKNMEDYQKDFVFKLCESIASTLSTAKTNERTKSLLEHSQQQAEEMRSQEEEMRQNIEEMNATQEEMQRKESDLTAIIKDLKLKVDKNK
jgi:methyl-accepting chemotaxis protein